MTQRQYQSALARYTRSLTSAAAVALLLSSTSCSSVNKYVTEIFSPNERAQAIAQADAKKAKPAGTATLKSAETPSNEPAKASPKQQLAAKPPASEAATAKAATTKVASAPVVADSARQKADAMDRLSRGEDPFAAIASSETSPHKKVAHVSAEVLVPEQRLSAADCPDLSGSPLGEACPPVIGTEARPMPRFEITDDEYVRDGGDKGLPVHYNAGNRAGLGLEDTVAEFQDDTGKIHVKASTVAEVYSPRFGEVRSSSLPQQGESIVKAEGHQDQTKVAGMNTKTVTSEQRQTDELKGIQTRSRASGLNARISDDQLDKAIAARNHTKLVNVYEEIRFIQEGTFDKVSKATLQESVTAAQEWADGRRPIIIAQDEKGQVLQGRFAAQDYTGVEDRRTPGDLKIIKVADKASAHPGDIVTFTIRFDNTGGRDLLKVRLVDNLSPRLEYIEGSIQSSLDGGVDAVDNGAGSQLLTFEFDNPLPGKTGGFVSFQCRVR
ncbi:MAG TPA: hypothetical protein VNQ76_22505 [Planctomicrobium sp.]|nr:hypothetical protein [Planctomicrobium sp.]